MLSILDSSREKTLKKKKKEAAAQRGDMRCHPGTGGRVGVTSNPSSLLLQSVPVYWKLTLKQPRVRDEIIGLPRVCL